jgi:hypothetical protein
VAGTGFAASAGDAAVTAFAVALSMAGDSFATIPWTFRVASGFTTMREKKSARAISRMETFPGAFPTSTPPR